MANSITKAQNYLADPNNLNGVFVAEAQLWFLMKEKFQVVNANTILLPKNTYSESAIPDYARATGYADVDITRRWDTYTLSQDWGMELQMDSMDLEESLSDGIISFGNDATRRLTVPRADGYIGAKLLSKAGKVVTEDITKANVLSEIDDAIVYFEEEGVTGIKHLLVTPQVYKAIKNADGFTRTLAVKDERTGIVRDVSYIDDVAVHSIKGKRLPANVNFFLVSEDSVFGVVKHNPSYVFQAGTYPGKDADVIDIRLYFDFFVIENKTEGIYANIYTEDKVTVTFNLNSNGVTGVSPKTNPTIKVFKGKATGLPTPPTSTTHDFVKWNYASAGTGDDYSGKRPIKADLTVYAIWEAK